MSETATKEAARGLKTKTTTLMIVMTTIAMKEEKKTMMMKKMEKKMMMMTTVLMMKMKNRMDREDQSLRFGSMKKDDCLRC